MIEEFLKEVEVVIIGFGVSFIVCCVVVMSVDVCCIFLDIRIILCIVFFLKF